MTRYTAEEVAGEWEFKILRSALGAFGDPARLQAILAEEGRAGWLLLEKFDDTRIRLKRHIRARASDASLDFDPYRTSVKGSGLSNLTLLALSALITLAVGAVIALLF